MRLVSIVDFEQLNVSCVLSFILDSNNPRLTQMQVIRFKHAPIIFTISLIIIIYMLIYRKSVISNVISNCDMDVLDSHVYSPSGITMLKYNNAEKFVLFSELVEGCDLDGFACQDFKEKGETLLRSSSLSVLRILYYFNSLCKSQLIDYWLLNDLLL